MANKMLIDATHPEETRVVVLRGNRVEEFDFETAHRKQLRGNIYLAKVTRVEPSLQAAFVEYGGNRHGFLAFSEIHPDYYQIPVADRQALLEADARDAREHDGDDDDHHRGGRRHRGRHHRQERHSASRGETVQSEPVSAEAHGNEEMAYEAADVVIDDSAADIEDATTSEQPSSETAEEDSHVSSAPSEQPPFEAAPVPAAELEQSPRHAEALAPESQFDVRDDEPHPVNTADAPYEAAPLPEGSTPAETAEHAAAVSGDEHDLNGNGANGHGPEENGHGPDEEDEVVESVGGADAMEEVPDRAPRYRRQYKIQEVIKRRQVMLVQVVKEERGTKGAALTTYLSLAGRYCVLMPNTARGGGISRKITSIDDRKKLREIAEELEVPEGMGVILRTAGAARTKAEVKRDFEYLLRQWELVRDLTLRSTAATLVYEEGSLAKRSIRDLYAKDIDEIIVAGEQGYRDAKDFMRMLMPSHARNVKLYRDSQPIFTRYGIESQLDAMFSPTVQLRSGGYVVLNQTEALVAIDVNSGRSTREHHIEDTALKTNVEAAEEIARQLRLRDLAGLIVIDFIDMDEKRNNRTVERRLKDALRNDRARIQVGRISHFGLMEMSRQRIRTSVLESSTEKCPHCGGTGHVRSVSSVALQLLRAVEEMLLKGPTHNLIVRTRPEIALYVLNHKRAHLRELEERFRITLTVSADEEVGGQTGFVIDRGEQVMTPEQARALLSQATASPPLVIEEEEEPEIAASEDKLDAEPDDAGQAAEISEHVTEIDEDTDSAHAEAVHAGAGEGDMGRDGGRRRRRRRGRGGRGGETREGGAYQPPQREHGAFEPGETGQDPAHGFEHAGEFAPTDMPAEQGFAQPHAEGGEHPGNGRGEGNGEHRRRRRGRRGGRRNRRDRNEANGDSGAMQETHSRADYSERPDWSPPTEAYAPQPVEAAPPPPAFEPAPVHHSPPAPTVTPAAGAPPPRRRSTIREPAPVTSASTPPVPPPMLTPEPSAAAVESAEDAAKPRRTGWWAKRLLGGKD